MQAYPSYIPQKENQIGKRKLLKYLCGETVESELECILNSCQPRLLNITCMCECWADAGDKEIEDGVVALKVFKKNLYKIRDSSLFGYSSTEI